MRRTRTAARIGKPERRGIGALVALVALAALASLPATAIGATPGASAGIRLPAFAPALPRGAIRTGMLPDARPVTIEVVLQPSNPDGLARVLADLYDPSSPRYQQWLTPGEFAQEFGPSPAAVDATTSWLHDRGLTDTTIDGYAVRASGSARAVAAALDVSFSSYQLAGGATAYSATSAPLVPQNVAVSVAAIVGLSDTVRFEHHLAMPRGRVAPGGAAAVPHSDPVAIAHGAPHACTNARNYARSDFWTPDEVGSIYGLPDLFDHGMTGKGKTIGLLELAPSRGSDTSAFLSCFGLHNTVTVHKIDGGAAPDQFGTLEADIDIQEAAISAPGAAVRSYEAPNSGSGEYHAFARMVHDNVTVISTSWGRCEKALDAEAPGFIGALHVLFQRAAAQGQSVFAASGDKGSEDCYNPGDGSPDTTLQVDSPADDVFVTGVGGTSLGARGLEPVWNDCENQPDGSCAAGNGDATGGGQSAHFARPMRQPKPAGSTCASCRGVPDVAANAGVPETFFDADFPPNGDPGPDNWVAVGGTSIASPKLAGLVADIASGCGGGRVGDFAPRLDLLASKHVYGTALTDITKGLDFTGASPVLVTPGDNDLTRNNAEQYKTATGFDLTTGMGTPIARGLSCPQVNKLSQRRGASGDHVTIHGLGLERATIKFGSQTARVLSATAAAATVVVPAGSGTVTVAATDPIGSGTHKALFGYPGADTGSYRMVDANGGVFAFGAQYSGSPAGHTTAPVVGMAVDHATGGYWIASADGNVYNFNAPDFGSLAGKHLNQPIVGIAATAGGDGFWLVARDGGIFTFGRAHYYGSTGGMHLNQPIVGIAPDERSGGYWLVASDGGIFAFHAQFYGSTGGMHLNQPIVGMIGDTRTGGYWLIASDGGVFAFNAQFYGSTGAIRLNQPIAGGAATGDSRGYWFVARDGGVFAFGDARFAGSRGGEPPGAPMVAMTTAH